MKVVFLGSSQFALPSIQAIEKTHHKILAVVTRPDKKAGRGLKLHQTPIKNFGLEKNLRVFQPENPNKDKLFIKELSGLKADVFVVVSYGHILSKVIVDMPLFFALNLHPSLLPKYRGAAPVNWAIIKGEQKTGVSVIKMVPKMDAGPVICQKEESISRYDSSTSLSQRLSKQGALGLVEALSLIENNKVGFKPQNEKEATFAPKLKKEDARLNFNFSAKELHDKIRGMLDWPTAFTFFENKRISLLESDYEDKAMDCPPSQVVAVDKDVIKVSARKGILVIKKLKPEGKKEMAAPDFARGYHMKEGDRFG